MSSAARQRLGQWFTPDAVADLAIALALEGRGASAVNLFDPTCGDGAFLSRAQAAGVAPAHLVGVDIDPAAATAAQARLPGARIERADLFATGGEFRADVVVGNPPYVRHERQDRARAGEIRAALAADYPAAADADLGSLVRRGDLAALCLLRALALTAPGGRASLVLSTAVLDADYAAPLWRTLGLLATPVALVAAPAERWFPDAAVNTMIAVFDRRPAADSVQVARLRSPTDSAAAAVRSVSDLSRVADVRSAPAEPRELATALRADPVWFDFRDRAGDALVRLGDLCEIRRGITSGANDIFYLPRARAQQLGLEPDVLAPLVRSPRGDGASIAVSPDDCSHVVLTAPRDSDELSRYPRCAAYLRDRQDASERPTLLARQPWWWFRARPARLFLSKAYAERFVQRLSATPALCDQRVYAVYPRALEARPMAALLNASTTAFAIESLGRASMGEGALEWTVGDVVDLPVLDIRRLDSARTAAIVDALEAMTERPIGTAQAERDRPDRADLDAAVATPFGLGDVLADVRAALATRAAQRSRR